MTMEHLNLLKRRVEQKSWIGMSKFQRPCWNQATLVSAFHSLGSYIMRRIQYIHLNITRRLYSLSWKFYFRSITRKPALGNIITSLFDALMASARGISHFIVFGAISTIRLIDWCYPNSISSVYSREYLKVACLFTYQIRLSHVSVPLPYEFWSITASENPRRQSQRNTHHARIRKVRSLMLDTKTNKHLKCHH